jgi:tagatose-6-phosphate ketose/aldose isomerase
MVEFSEGKVQIDEELLAVCSVLPVQILSFFKALHLGLEPDSPSVNGAITRVVEGVTIYPYDAALQANYSL